ncbi:methyltransferase [Marinithermus hydrothermalis]|uniref:Methyltransferase small n=1 Tax=Marinithermus hydrothermalis (strain DSM 14884 / JCM 11576 / T1) TaxID=869210 RepID=F2NMM4_MARHT|nr:methyltransferase [Marinithermus hydrothermalis]AEB12194.1 methyltransferase small [Marinithermus hydrothermalis DSM 14884]
MTLEAYHRLKRIPFAHGGLYAKPGARGYPDPVHDLLARTLEPIGERALDLNPGVGLTSLTLAHAGLAVDLIETSRAALRCLEATAREVRAWRVRRGLPWEVEPEAYDLVALPLPAERGSAWVRQCLIAASRALKPGGRLWLAGDRRKGFERYFKEARALVGYGVVVTRDGPYRVAVLEREGPAPAPEEAWRRFESTVLGQRLAFHHLPGVFSAGKIDPASLLLLEALEGPVRGLRVLDLGGGYGALGAPLARLGAEVTLVEDEWPAVLSAQRTLEANGLEGRVLHSDVDEALKEGEAYDIVVTNPPFHVGGNVILDVARAFVQAAYARTRPGGRFFLVANPFLKYEPLMEALFGNYRTARVDRYKVLVSEKPA